MGAVAVRSNCIGRRSTHARRSTTRISKQNANRSMEWKLKSWGWKSINVSVTKKRCEGATINACNGRKQLPIAHAMAFVSGFRIRKTVDDITRRHFHAEQRKSSCKEFGSPSTRSSFLCIQDQEPSRARTMDRAAPSLAITRSVPVAHLNAVDPSSRNVRNRPAGGGVDPPDSSHRAARSRVEVVHPDCNGGEIGRHA